MMDYPWKRAWIVGGSTGLGAEFVSQLDDAGIAVTVSARSKQGLDDLCAPLRTAVSLPLDITDAAAVNGAVGTVMDAESGSPDLIILNAAIYTPMAGANMDADIMADMMTTNFIGVARVLQCLMAYRKHPKKITVAVLGSPSGWTGLPGGIGYGPTKAAIINMVEGLKPELDRTSIDIRLVNPGFIRTRLTDKNKFKMPQLMEADDAAARALKGLAKGKFETAFPNPFVGFLKFMGILPYRLFFALTKRAM